MAFGSNFGRNHGIASIGAQDFAAHQPADRASWQAGVRFGPCGDHAPTRHVRTAFV
jgi:hypothetical protein